VIFTAKRPVCLFIIWRSIKSNELERKCEAHAFSFAFESEKFESGPVWVCWWWLVVGLGVLLAMQVRNARASEVACELVVNLGLPMLHVCGQACLRVCAFVCVCMWLQTCLICSSCVDGLTHSRTCLLTDITSPQVARAVAGAVVRATTRNLWHVNVRTRPSSQD
jgi:hypothetical protein